MENCNLAAFYFHQGTNFRSYEYLGCNESVADGSYEYTFRVWAPHADRVDLLSDVYGWNSPYPLERVTENGVWECRFSSAEPCVGAAYKYRIFSAGKYHLKGDPFAKASKGGADGASIIVSSEKYKWGDGAWMTRRGSSLHPVGKKYLSSPINIYEVHAGSFIRHDDNSYYTYRELAEVLIPYVKYMGYTHVELLPIAEHPYDGSWGYQVCGFYAPTSRFGTPDDFRYLIDSMHRAGIGVIIDWVPAHFPKDEWGLYEFDGYPLYEYQGSDRIESQSWGTRFFDLGREEIQSFLISNALYFMREFHVDGLRVDAVASMLYLDYDKAPGKWIPNYLGTNINLEGEAFLRKLNTAVFAEFPDVLMIAEESASYNGITHSVDTGGLGFNLKWNMGWANDFYDYVMTDPYFRRYKHKALNFPLMYAFRENYVLPISHDEVVHGKLSFIDKMHGSYADKFRQMRASLLLMMSYPGKKMLFMGTEYGQFREWDFANSLEWFMLDYPMHRSIREYVASLNRFYLDHSELWELDHSEDGFEWILPDEAEKNIVAYNRKNIAGDTLSAVISFSGSDQELTLEFSGEPEIVFDSEGAFDKERFVSVKKQGRHYFAKINIPAFSGILIRAKKRRNKKILKET